MRAEKSSAILDVISVDRARTPAPSTSHFWNDHTSFVYQTLLVCLVWVKFIFRPLILSILSLIPFFGANISCLSEAHAHSFLFYFSLFHIFSFTKIALHFRAACQWSRSLCKLSSVLKYEFYSTWNYTLVFVYTSTQLWQVNTVICTDGFTPLCFQS